jgi:hypothetical protein
LPLPAFLHQTIVRRHAATGVLDWANSRAVIPSAAKNLLCTRMPGSD